MVLVMKFNSCSRSLSGILVVGALALGGCDNGKAGSVDVRVWGEGYLEEGVPAKDVEDAWKVDFSAFVVTLRDVAVAGQNVALESPKIDATKKSKSEKAGERGQKVGAVEVEEGQHANAEFTVASTIVEGEASKGDKKVKFKWVFNTPVRYSNCEAKTKVKAGTTASFEITMHADHYLYDSLTADKEPKLLFGPIAAADVNGDGEITQQELEKAPIADEFDTGSQKISNMWAWLSAHNLTIAHTDGEHHCKSKVLEEKKDSKDKVS